MSEEKSGEEKSKDPLSNEAWNWIMLLSGEIHNCSTQFLMFGSVVMVCIVACLGGVIAVLALKIPLSKYIAFVLLLLALFSGLEFKKERYVNQKRLKTLINIREDIISDESIDFIEVRRRWKEYIKK